MTIEPVVDVPGVPPPRAGYRAEGDEAVGFPVIVSASGLP